MMRVHSAWCRMEVRWRRHVRGVGVGVELPEALAALLAELRMKREALEAALTTHRLDRHVFSVDIQVLRNRPAALNDPIELAAHVADKHVKGTRLGDEIHHTRRHAVDVRQRCEFLIVHTDDAFSCGNCRWERVAGCLRKYTQDRQ